MNKDFNRLFICKFHFESLIMLWKNVAIKLSILPMPAHAACHAPFAAKRNRRAAQKGHIV